MTVLKLIELKYRCNSKIEYWNEKGFFISSDFPKSLSLEKPDFRRYTIYKTNLATEEIDKVSEYHKYKNLAAAKLAVWRMSK